MRFAKPDVGTKVRVTIPRHGPVYPGYYIPETVIQGEVVESANHDDPLSFRVTTGWSYHPVAIVAIKRVSKLENVDGLEMEKVEEVKPTAKSFRVPSSKGNEYIVTIDDRGVYFCECKGFGFRRTCKHVNEIKSQVEGVK